MRRLLTLVAVALLIPLLDAPSTLPGLGSRRVEGAIVIHTGSAGG